MDLRFPPKKVKLGDGSEKESRSFNYLKIKKRTKGIMFYYEGRRFIYEYEENFDHNYGGTIECIDIRPQEDVDKNEDFVFGDWITYVDIIETDYGYVTSAILNIMDLDVKDLIENKFDQVALKMAELGDAYPNQFHQF
jgi:hypothetical protein